MNVLVFGEPSLAPLVVSLLISLEINWRSYYILNILLLLILLFILYRIKIPVPVRARTNIKKLLSENKKLIVNPAFILVAILIFFYEPVMETFYTWFTSYFESIDVGVGTSSVSLTIY